jgi:hypothetical protein
MPAAALAELLEIVPHAFINLACHWCTRSLYIATQLVSSRCSVGAFRDTTQLQLIVLNRIYRI